MKAGTLVTNWIHFLSIVVGRFQAVILMSGSSLAPWAMGYRVKEASLQLAKELGCSTTNSDAIINCLRYQDANRITQAYYRVIDFYNGTDVFGPVVDSYLPKDVQYIARSPWEAMERGEFPKIPVITGISSKDGLLMISKDKCGGREQNFNNLHRLYLCR